MRENIFRFKQFSVRNERSAMKVGTDGVLLGALCSVESVNSVLDVGCGTGLIALMIAQRTRNAIIDSVEIDADAYNEALLNYAESPWNNRLFCFLTDFREFTEKCHKKYDLIVSNPPFYTEDVTPPDSQRLLARHCSALSFKELIESSIPRLSNNGKLWFISPTNRENEIANIIAANKIYISNKTIIFPKTGVAAKRIVWALTKNPVSNILINNLTIENSIHHDYTDEYIALTRDFYLKM